MLVFTMLLMVSGEAADAKSKQPREDRVICERTMSTGTKLGKKVCMKASEWEFVRRESKLNLDLQLKDQEHLLRQSQAGPSPTGATVQPR